MGAIPTDAPRSEDGYYWWDGSQWLPVDPAQDGQAPSDDPVRSAGAQSAGTESDTAQVAESAYPMTDDLFANMLRAAESDAQEA
jgi:hypothetical protein